MPRALIEDPPTPDTVRMHGVILVKYLRIGQMELVAPVSRYRMRDARICG
jgi:hypothetical protein